MIGQRRKIATHPANVDATVHAHWPELSGLMAPYRLEARFIEAEDDSVDDAIEIRRLGSGDDHDLGDIQIDPDGRTFSAATWTSAAHQERRHGDLRSTVSDAFGDLVSNLRKDAVL